MAIYQIRGGLCPLELPLTASKDGIVYMIYVQ